MLKEAKIILPVGRGGEHPTWSFLRRVVKEFGGYTAIRAEGPGTTADGRMVVEPVIVVNVALPPLAAVVSQFRDLAEAARVEFAQEAVYIQLPNGDVEFVTAETTAERTV